MIDMAKWRTLQRHPLSEAFGDMSELEFEAVCADMAEHGYDERKKISVYEGKILDGWNRQRAAIVSHKVPSYSEYKGNDPLGFVIRENMNRRHLDASQRALIAGRIANYSHGGNRRKFQDAHVHLETLKTAAAKLEVSERSAAAGRKVVEQGIEELQKAVSDGTLSIRDAASVADKPKAEQRKAVIAVRSGKATTARAAVAPKPAEPKDRKSKPITDTRLRKLVEAADSLLAEEDADKVLERSTALAGAVRDLALDMLNHPAIEEVEAYCKERGGKVNAAAWFSYYESNGWQVGKQRMKDWRACVRYWEQNARDRNGKATGRVSSPASTIEAFERKLAKSRAQGSA